MIDARTETPRRGRRAAAAAFRELLRRRAPTDGEAAVPLVAAFPEGAPCPDDDGAAPVLLPLDTPLPLFAALFDNEDARAFVSDPGCGGGVPVPARFARFVPALVELTRECGDLTADAWARVDVRALAEAAAFFMVPRDAVARIVELGFHRRAVAAACPAIAEAIAADSASRMAIAAQGPRLDPWSTLRRVDGPVPWASADVAGAPALLAEFADPAPLVGAAAAPPDALAMDPLAARVLREFENVVVAGGAALFSVLPRIEAGDVDYFVWGVRGTAEADALLRGILRVFLDFDPSLAVACVSENAVTVNVNGVLHQVVLRLYDTPDQLLHGFDLAASEVLVRANHALPGAPLEAWCTAKFLAAVAHGAVWVDPGRQSLSYVMRMWKYWLKGFLILLFGLDDRGDVRGDVFTACDVGSLPGLGLLLRMENDVRQFMHWRGYTASDPRRVWLVERQLRVMCRKHGLSRSDYARPDAAPRHLPLARILDERAAMPLAWVPSDPARVRGSFHPVDDLFYHGAVCPVAMMNT